MILLLASTLVFLASVILVFAGFLTSGLPARFFHWVMDTGLNRWPWLQAVADWFLFPCLLLVLLVAAVILLRVVLGSPRRIMRQYDWPLEPQDPPAGLDGMRYRFWSRWFGFWVFRKDAVWPFPFAAYPLMVLAGAAAIGCGVLLGLFPAAMYPGGSHPTLLIAALLVYLGMSAAHRDVAARIREIREGGAVTDLDSIADVSQGQDRSAQRAPNPEDPSSAASPPAPSGRGSAEVT
ncbi:MAG TPA: hypothetical protein PKJ98_11360 [Verrucomicrobiota bacterium]|nr:hypothetical protein [Verrucomicrobiota bacterium]